MGPTDPNFQQMEKIKILILNRHVKKWFCCFRHYVKSFEEKSNATGVKLFLYNEQ